MKRYIIVCEGFSEQAYLQGLQSFLDRKTGEWPVPLQFSPKMAKNSDGTDNRHGRRRVRWRHASGRPGVPWT